MNLRRAVIMALIAAAPLCALGQVSQPYTLTDLGSFGANSYGYGINSAGEVTGYADSSSGAPHAFLYSSGLMQDLGTLGGSYSRGAAVNLAGQTTGYGSTSSLLTHAFLYANGSMQDLGTLGGGYSFGESVNGSGQVVGFASTASNASLHAFLYANGLMQDLGTLGGTYSQGYSVNSAGQATGLSSTPASGVIHAFLYQNGAMQDLGSLGGTYSVGNAINAAGQVAGVSTTATGMRHAFLYENGTMQDLGTLGGNYSVAYAINFAGQVTGSSTTATGTQHAFVYSGGTMLDLNTVIDPSSTLAPYVALTEARAINDTGLIVANGVDSRTGLIHAYLLTPPPQGVSDCEHVDGATPLYSAVFTRDRSQPAAVEADFSSAQAGPGIVCVENGADSSLPVTAGSVVLNGEAIVGPSDFKRTASASMIQIRVPLSASNELDVRLASAPGAQVRVRVFTAASQPAQ